MWALGRRTALFIVSYAPLAAMFMVLEWPSGWSTMDLVDLAVWLVAVAFLLVGLASASSLTGPRWKLTIGLGVAVAMALVIVGVVHDWTAPMTLNPPKGRSSATTTGVAWGVCVAAALLVVAIIGNAQRVGGVSRRISNPRDQGGAVAAYLATYLLPLLNTGGGDWRLTAAYAIYILTVYVVFVRSDSLVLVNPTLYMFGFRIYDVQVDSDDERNRTRVVLLMKGNVYNVRCVRMLPLGDNSYLGWPEE
jgi:hypothetical protein